MLYGTYWVRSQAPSTTSSITTHWVPQRGALTEGQLRPVPVLPRTACPSGRVPVSEPQPSYLWDGRCRMPTLGLFWALGLTYGSAWCGCWETGPWPTFPPGSTFCSKMNSKKPYSFQAPEEGNGSLLQHSCLGESHGQRSLEAKVHRVIKSWTQLKQLSTHACHSAWPKIHVYIKHLFVSFISQSQDKNTALFILPSCQVL